MEKDKSTLSKKRNKPLLIIGVIIAIILLVALAVYIAVNIFLSSIRRIDPNAEYGSNLYGVDYPGNAAKDFTPENDPAETIFAGKNVVNILVVGQDRRQWDEEGPQRTDAMILCTIDRQKKTVTMTSFLPDLWVYVPGLYNQRLNMPYKLGGFPLLNNTLEYNFGIRADYNMEIDFYGFMEAIDSIGGIEVSLSGAEAKYLNKRGNWGVVTDPKWHLKEGENLLNGSQALAYTRIKELGTEFERTNRHTKLLKALALKIEGMSSADLFDLSREIFPLLCTDMTNNQMFELILQLLPIMRELEINTQHIPLNAHYTYEKKR